MSTCICASNIYLIVSEIIDARSARIVTYPFAKGLFQRAGYR